jgi:hypothetical protein
LDARETAIYLAVSTVESILETKEPDAGPGFTKEKARAFVETEAERYGATVRWEAIKKWRRRTRKDIKDLKVKGAALPDGLAIIEGGENYIRERFCEAPTVETLRDVLMAVFTIQK